MTGRVCATLFCATALAGLGWPAGAGASPDARSAPAPASASAPDRRATAADLAYVLGEAHALRQVCAGQDDGGWRVRMQRMLEVEGPDPALRRRLTARFNAGFLAQRALFPTCSPKVSDAERVVARRGVDLSRRLSGPPP